MMNLVLLMTNSCNLKCNYCFVEKEKEVLEFDTYLEILNKYKDKISRITFFGGEPLLYFDNILKIIDYNDKNNINVNYNINTNGLLLNKKVIDLCIKKNILLNVSIDGNKESNILNRCNEKEFNILYKNIVEAKNRNCDIYVNYVVTPNNLEYLVDGTKFLIEEGFTKLCYMMNYEAHWTYEDLDSFNDKLKIVADYIIDNELNIKLYPFTTKIKAIFNDLEVEKCNFGNESIVVDPKGNIYPCMSFIGNKDFIKKSDDYKYTNTVDIKKCFNCTYLKYCSNNCMCKYHRINNNNNFDVNCELERIFIKNAMYYCKKLMKKGKDIK